ncbi:formyltetrahydrofolate deformylase [Mumia flava]|uniref:Formyltetrahydrofolate deformylase n=1 Tax=Mumia flava TaxID=1348852 RepID=A0A0B2BI82_9ACTN|nr:formyltetrahydrofolate deformylase [Mumia flava]PJJ58452.1 formyltetrahydrofolate deformylase [Mumia flava]
MSEVPTYVLTLTCPDRPGLVHAISSWVVEQGGNILDAQQFTDADGGRFFLRVHVEPTSGEAYDTERLRAAFAPVAEQHAMTWSLVVAEAPCRTLVLVSKEGHCLNDLLFRQSIGALNIEIAAVVSNHTVLERMAASYDVPFHHVPVTKETKADAEAEMLRLVDELDVDLVVLARYMQILSDDACRALEGRAINIHHSFLPSFKGARPYHQAHDRGVKLIGATAHYVTADLDEGPIIEQDVTRVGHQMGPSALVQAGRDVETRVLSRAVGLHAEQRVLLNGARTVVFP